MSLRPLTVWPGFSVLALTSFPVFTTWSRMLADCWFTFWFVSLDRLLVFWAMGSGASS